MVAANQAMTGMGIMRQQNVLRPASEDPNELVTASQSDSAATTTPI